MLEGVCVRGRSMTMLRGCVEGVERYIRELMERVCSKEHQ